MTKAFDRNFVIDQLGTEGFLRRTKRISRKADETNSMTQLTPSRNIEESSSNSSVPEERKSKPESSPSIKKKPSRPRKQTTTDRISQLAQPKMHMVLDDISKKEILSLRSLIIYKTTPRLLELAKPRRVEKPDTREIGRIPSRVLRAQPTSRLIELSKPRIIRDPDAAPKPRKYLPRPKNFNYNSLLETKYQFPAEDIQIPERLRKKLEEQLQKCKEKVKKKIRTNASDRSIIDIGAKRKPRPSHPSRSKKSASRNAR